MGDLVPALERINYKGEFTYETQIRFAPPSCRDTALRLLYEMGLYITGAEEENGQCCKLIQYFSAFAIRF